MLTLAGIVVPAAVVVAAVRRWVTPVSWRAAALFLLATLAFLHGAVFSSKLPVPVDEVARGYPYRGLFGDVVARNPMTNDTVKLFLPWMQVAREELLHGHLPLWNRFAFSGYPLLANAEAAPFSPLFLATLFVPLPKQIVAMAGLKVFLSLLFTFLFVKREGGSDAAAAFAAVAYAFSSFQTVCLYYSVSAVTALLPMMLFAILDALDRPSRRAAVFVAIAVATICANGHPESVVHVAIAAAIVLAIDIGLSADRRDWVRRSLTPLLGALAGVAMAAPVWVPAAQQVLLSTRYADLHANGPKMQIPATAAWALLNPNGFGNPARHNWSWILNYMTVAESYVGLLVLVLFVAAAFSPRTGARSRWWIAAALLTFIAAMDWTFIGHALSSIPPLSVAANDKLRFVSLFLAIIVAARWLDEVGRSAGSLPAGPPAASRRSHEVSNLQASSRWWSSAHRVFSESFDGAAACATLLLAAVPILAASLYVDRKQIALLSPLDLAGVVAVIAFVVIFAACPSRQRIVATAACALTLAELFCFNVDFNRLVDAKYFRPTLPIVQALRAHAPNEPFRIVGLDWVFLPNAAAQYGLEDVRGSDPMSLAGYTRILATVGDVAAGTDVIRVLKIDDPLLDFLNVRFLLAEPDAAVGGKWRLIYRGADGALFENLAVKPRFSALHGAVQVVQQSSARFELRIDAQAATTVVSSQPAAPGWRVTVNGHRGPVRIIEQAFLGFDVPAGRSEVVLSYRPMAFFGSLPIALAGVVLLAVCHPERRARDLGAGRGVNA
jgi:hypothetical protein